MSTLASPLARGTITPEDLLRMPDAGRYELVDGKLVERNVSIESSRVALQVGRLLGNVAERTHEAFVYAADLGYQCVPDDPNRVRKPDASVVRKDRLREIQGDRGYMPIAADLVVEVVSSNDLAYEVAEKVEEYLSAGFGVVWVVHPHLRTITIYRPGGASSVLHQNDSITGDPALPSFRCRVEEFFVAP